MRRLDVLAAVVFGALLLADAGDAPVPLVLALVSAGPLVLRAPSPLLCVALLALGNGVYGLIAGDPDSVASLPPLLLAAYSVGAHERRRSALLGLAALLAFAASVGFQGPEKEGDIVFVTILLGFPWAAGLVARDSQHRAELLERLVAELEHEQREHERLVLTAERARIAAELNDAVAHAVGAMTIQAGAAEQALERDPGAAQRALSQVQDVGRAALEELHRMLALLRAPT